MECDSSDMRYETPAEFYFRLHHVRPRFKNNVESVLLFVCQRIANIQNVSGRDWDQTLFQLIRTFPGNAEKSTKTIHNWRTEISALFGLVKRNGELSEAGFYAKLLSKNEDLVEFFRYFLFTFQYPGGHVKPDRVAKQIEAGVRFHPAKFLVNLFFEGQQLVADGKQFSVSSAEVTALVFNDLRVTALNDRGPKEVAQIILHNRQLNYEYDQTGDVVRYAQDLLDYLVLGDVLAKRVNTNTYYMKPNGSEIALAIAERAPAFHGYDHLYGRGEVAPNEAASVEEEWLDFVNIDRTSEAFVGDILSILETSDEKFNSEIETLFESIRLALDGDSRDIGRAGESVVLSHEFKRLSKLERVDLARKVKKIPDHLGVGYDILSFEGLEKDELSDLNRYIEVKTTRSKRKLSTSSFTLTPNEWRAARSLGDSYFVYRLIISEGALRMFIIKDPYEQERLGTLSMTPRNGAEISYSEDAGCWEEILASTRVEA